MKIRVFCLLVSLLMSMSIAPLSFAAETDEARAKAEEIHSFASSDSIYADEELKALYYQNIQIIDLLKEIRGLLQEQLDRGDENR